MDMAILPYQYYLTIQLIWNRIHEIAGFGRGRRGFYLGAPGKFLNPQGQSLLANASNSLVIFEGLASGEYFSRMDQEEAIAINGILMK